MLNSKNQRKMKKLVYLLMLPVLSGTVAIASVNYVPETRQGQKMDLHMVPGEGDVNPAQYVGGDEALFAFIGETVVYPEEAKKNNLQGKVMVKMIITETGKVTEVEVKQSSGHEVLDNEAVRAVNLMPDWTPATKDGKNVKSENYLPIVFKL